ncbi:MAG: DUF420 domain-containing protein [Candidatus Tectomicrobia bacterium]|uniref:DUF420 domain-containing protein n=1 Tax=Tectimicrobiota bacterium TaxID=2528274 RepID=A0A932ZV45_UNCTE|nr:DUF420 domain-containing protein [Candidatus Tectomicrobia bacterium]
MFSVSQLPALNAALNATSALLLIAGYLQIRALRVRQHRACMLSAFAVSILFLISYLTYHYHAGSIRFTGQGWVRPVYFAVLISHTVLAAAVPVLAVLTLRLAWRREFLRHRRLARWTFPIWLYVSVTGVAIYAFLYWLYPAR